MRRAVDSLNLDERVKLQERVISILAREISPRYFGMVVKTAMGQAMQELLDEMETSHAPSLPSNIEVQEILKDMTGALGAWAVEIRKKNWGAR